MGAWPKGSAINVTMILSTEDDKTRCRTPFIDGMERARRAVNDLSSIGRRRTLLGPGRHRRSTTGWTDRNQRGGRTATATPADRHSQGWLTSTYTQVFSSRGGPAERGRKHRPQRPFFFVGIRRSVQGSGGRDTRTWSTSSLGRGHTSRGTLRLVSASMARCPTIDTRSLRESKQVAGPDRAARHPLRRRHAGTRRQRPYARSTPLGARLGEQLAATLRARSASRQGSDLTATRRTDNRGRSWPARSGRRCAGKASRPLVMVGRSTVPYERSAASKDTCTARPNGRRYTSIRSTGTPSTSDCGRGVAATAPSQRA